jgi:carboxyl-terminal processing protease
LFAALALLPGAASALAEPAASPVRPPARVADPAPAPEPAADQTAPALIADFDEAWRIVNDTHFDPTFNGVDWNAVRDELRPKALEATTQDQIRGVIMQMLGRLGQSHFSVIPKETADPVAAAEEAKNDKGGAADAQAQAQARADRPAKRETPTQHDEGQADAGFDVRLLKVGDKHRVIVTSVRPGTPAAAAGVRPGWAVVEIGLVDVDQLAEGMLEAVPLDDAPIYTWSTAQALTQGAEGSACRVLFEKLDGTYVDLDITRSTPPGQLVDFGNLPPMRTSFEHRMLDETDGAGGASIGLMAFNVWMMPVVQGFDRAMQDFHAADGVIIDLRGNIGGVGFLSVGLARYLLSEKGNLGDMTMRDNTLSFNVEPIRVTPSGTVLEPFTGPVAILVDSVSASTSEVFAGGIQAIDRERIRVFGQRSAGAALPALMSRLPSGDVLLHAMASFVTSEGQYLEDTGVVPDEPITPSREDLEAGRDPVMDAAIAWIRAKRG